MMAERQILFKPLDVEGDGEKKPTKSIILKHLKLMLFPVTSHRCKYSFVVLREEITGI